MAQVRVLRDNHQVTVFMLQVQQAGERLSTCRIKRHTSITQGDALVLSGQNSPPLFS